MASLRDRNTCYVYKLENHTLTGIERWYKCRNYMWNAYVFLKQNYIFCSYLLCKTLITNTDTQSRKIPAIGGDKVWSLSDSSLSLRLHTLTRRCCRDHVDERDIQLPMQLNVLGRHRRRHTHFSRQH